MDQTTRKAGEVLSGRLVATTAAAIAQPRALRAMRDHVPLRPAERRAVQHIIVDFDLRLIGGSALTADLGCPKGRAVAEIGQP